MASTALRRPAAAMAPPHHRMYCRTGSASVIHSHGAPHRTLRSATETSRAGSRAGRYVPPRLPDAGKGPRTLLARMSLKKPRAMSILLSGPVAGPEGGVGRWHSRPASSIRSRIPTGGSGGHGPSVAIAVAILVIGLGASAAGRGRHTVGRQRRDERSPVAGAGPVRRPERRPAPGPGFREQSERAVHLGAAGDERAAGRLVHHARCGRPLPGDDRIRVRAAGAGGRPGRVRSRRPRRSAQLRGRSLRPTPWSRRHHGPSTASSATPPCWTSSGWGPDPPHLRLLRPDHPGGAGRPRSRRSSPRRPDDREAHRPVRGQLSVHQEPRRPVHRVRPDLLDR